MINTINQMVSVLDQTAVVARKHFNNPDSIAKLENEKEQLEKKLQADSFIKVPFVGGFSAGKSSLINAYMGINILPTDITPETAVAYEIYFSNQEKLEVFKNGSLSGSFSLSQIKQIEVKPGDVVKLFVNNEKIKNLNDKNIVIVDMPGIDSGIEAHNNAILNYIQEGVHFILVHEITQGTLQTSTINFINEVKKYSLSSSVLLSKTDKVTPANANEVKTEIEKTVKFLLGENAFVGLVSAADNSTADLDAVLNSLDADQMIQDLYGSSVSNFVVSTINELELQIKLLLTNKQDFSGKIAQLKNAKADAISDIQKRNGKAQNLQDSANDIIRDIHDALMTKSSTLAQSLYNGGNNTDLFNQELLNVIRPVLVNSFKRELTEYQDVVGQALNGFADNVNDILNDKDNKILSEALQLAEQFLGKDVLEGLLKKGIDAMMKKFAAYKGISALLKTVSKILGPIITIVVSLLPDILRLIFGASSEKKIEKIRQSLTETIFGKITEGMRPEVEKMLCMQREQTLVALQKMVEEESKKFDDNIQAMQKEQELSEQETASRISELKAAINSLETLK